MTEVNPFANPPVCRYEDVLTIDDLIAVRNGYLFQWENTPWYKPIEKFKFRAAVGTINSLLSWIMESKPVIKRK